MRSGKPKQREVKRMNRAVATPGTTVDSIEMIDGDHAKFTMSDGVEIDWYLSCIGLLLKSLNATQTAELYHLMVNLTEQELLPAGMLHEAEDLRECAEGKSTGSYAIRTVPAEYFVASWYLCDETFGYASPQIAADLEAEYGDERTTIIDRRHGHVEETEDARIKRIVSEGIKDLKRKSSEIWDAGRARAYRIRGKKFYTKAS